MYLKMSALDIQPSVITDLKTFLNSTKCWAYVNYLEDGVEKSIDVNNLDDPEIYKRIRLNPDKRLEFTRFAEDLYHNGLRPRVELSFCNQRLRKNKVHHIRYEVSLLKGKDNMRGMIFQIMDQTPDKKTLPITQFEIRYNTLMSRWTEISSSGQSTGTNIDAITPVVFDSTKWYNLDMFICLSTDPKKGHIKTFLDGSMVFERRAITCSSAERDPQIQFGIYAVKGFELKTQVRRLKWIEVPSVPTGTTFGV